MTVFRVRPKGDLLLVKGTTAVREGAAYATQRITVDLNVFLGEWFLDKRLGLPYFRDLLIHSPNSDTVRTVFREGIMQTQDIVAVPLLNVVLDTTNRVAYVDFASTYADGTTTPGSLAINI